MLKISNLVNAGVFFTWTFLQSLARCNFLLVRTFFWWRKVYQPFSALFRGSGYPIYLQKRYLSFIATYVIPSLGPSPSEFTKFQPCSFMGDDHTPIELSWVLNANGEHTVRFTMELLSALDGSPTPSSTWMASLRLLSEEGCVEGFEMDWVKTCFEALVHDGILVENSSQHHSQFSVGADFTRSGVVGKAYFLPHVLSQASGKSQMDLVTSCLTKLELESQWNHVTKYLDGLPPHLSAIPEIVAVDCVEKTRNRAKVYVRSKASSLNEIVDLFTLGGALGDPLVVDTVRMIRQVWHLLFDGADDDTRLESRNPNHYASPFVVYFELGLGRQYPVPKLYIPVRHYCQNDSVVANALVQFYKQDEFSGKANNYLADIQAAFGHPTLEECTGLHTYIGIATRKAGPQLSVYLSPLAFGSEKLAEVYSK